MTVRDLIEELSKLNPYATVLANDTRGWRDIGILFSGTGIPPQYRPEMPMHMQYTDWEECTDENDPLAVKVVVI